MALAIVAEDHPPSIRAMSGRSAVSGLCCL